MKRGCSTIRRSTTSEQQVHNTFLFHAAFWSSLFYFIAVAAVPLVIDPVVHMSIQNLFKFAAMPLGILQGLVTALIGKFFIANR